MSKKKVMDDLGEYGKSLGSNGLFLALTLRIDSYLSGITSFKFQDGGFVN